MRALIGDLQFDRIEEFYGPAIKPQEFLSGLPEEAIERNLGWLAPSFYDVASGQFIMSVHTWIVRTRHHTVLIDTCFGNDKQRPNMEAAHMLKTPYLARLSERGLSPESIDFVMCTHMHADHVGWNTRLVDGRWVPTFPNARYLFSRREYEHWNPEADAAIGWGQENVFADSVLPCVEAGLATLVDDGFEVDDALRVEAAPGHTVGNTLVRARSGGRSALFTGDCLHTPLQVVYPDVNTVVCELPEVARATRRRILAECADQGHLLLPAHFPAPHFGSISRDGESFNYHPHQ